jgi:FkbM family methyltransferase
MPIHQVTDRQISENISIRDNLLTVYYTSGLRGFTRLWHLLKQWGNRSHLLVKNKYGAKFYLDPESYIDSHVIKSGYYESEVLEAILPFLESQSVFWDIGANFGLHAITAKFLMPEIKVVCIEPSPIVASQLQANCKLNNLQVELVNIALSNTLKFQDLHLVEGNAGMSTLKPWSEASYSSKVTCWCDTGDNLVSNHVLPQPTVIKIDVEGSELEVFLGMPNILQNPVLKVILFEEASDFVETKNSLLYHLLSDAGFTITSLIRQEETHHNLDNFIASRN